MQWQHLYFFQVLLIDNQFSNLLNHPRLHFHEEISEMNIVSLLSSIAFKTELPKSYCTIILMLNSSTAYQCLFVCFMPFMKYQISSLSYFLSVKFVNIKKINYQTQKWITWDIEDYEYLCFMPCGLRLRVLLQYSTKCQLILWSLTNIYENYRTDAYNRILTWNCNQNFDDL